MAVIISSANYAAAGGDTAQATAFITRANAAGLTNATIRQAYKDFINSMVNFDSGAMWGVFDVLQIWATQGFAGAPNAAAALAVLNLPSTAHTSVLTGGVLFTAATGSGACGIGGNDASTTDYVDSNFAPGTAGGNYSQNSAHIAAWNNTNAASTASGGIAAGLDYASNSSTHIFPKFSTNLQYYRINDNSASPSAGGSMSSTSGDPRGLIIANRSGASTQQGYLRGVDQSITPVSSGPIATTYNLVFCARNTQATGISLGSAHQIMAVSAGGSLTSSQVTAYTTYLHTYLTTVAGIAY